MYNEESTEVENIVDNVDNNTIDTPQQVLEEYVQDGLFRDALYNDLMGDYDESGKYVVAEDIMQDLIDMPKKIDFIDDEGIHARGFLADRTFNFLVTQPIKEENGNAYCFLKLDETIDRMGGFSVEVKSTIIATYDYTFNEFYDDYVRDVFHLKEYDSDDTGEEGRQYRAEYIDKRYEMFYVMREVSEEHYEKLEEIYFNHRLLLLGMDPDLIVIMAEFNKKRIKLEPYFMISRRRFYFLNQLLDEILQLQNNKELLSKSQIAQKLKELDKKYIQKSKEIKQKIQEHPRIAEFKKTRATFEINMPDKPKAPKPSLPKGVKKGDAGKSKSGGKKKGGKGKSGGDKKGGGKDKKKDKPKFGGGAKDKPSPSYWTDNLNIEPLTDTFTKITNEQTLEPPVPAPEPPKQEDSRAEEMSL